MAPSSSRSAQRLAHAIDTYRGLAEQLHAWLGQVTMVLPPADVELLEHTLLLATELTRPTSQRPVELARYLQTQATRINHYEALTSESAATLCGEALTVILPLLEQPELPCVVDVDGLALRLLDLMRLRLVELTALVDSLNQGLHDDPALSLPPAALAETSRTCAEILAQRYPGQAIEVRVPPYAAVQLSDGTGPTHTRGTPPSVVETSPQTFIRLAAGRLHFHDAVAQGAVTASGAHCDLSTMFPLL
ncbi:MAG: sterol carrier family protein [Propionibacteriaceae bacterium]